MIAAVPAVFLAIVVCALVFCVVSFRGRPTLAEASASQQQPCQPIPSREKLIWPCVK
jgi:hypothetical protein